MSVILRNVSSLHTLVCERLSVMQEQARLVNFLVHNSLGAPLKYLRNVVSRVPFPPNENSLRSWDFGFDLVQSPPLPQMKIWSGFGTLSFE